MADNFGGTLAPNAAQNNQCSLTGGPHRHPFHNAELAETRATSRRHKTVDVPQTKSKVALPVPSFMP
jgi:hypothetical protein